MFTRADIKPLSIAAATAVCAGLGLGAWATPPERSAGPTTQVEIQPIYGDDPNLARYKQVIAEQGGPGPLYIVTGYTAPAVAQTAPDEEAAAEARLEREAAEFEAETRAWEAERTARLRAAQAQWSAPLQSAAYGQPEQVTSFPSSQEAGAYPVLSPG